MRNLLTFVKLPHTPVTSSEFLLRKIVFQLMFVCSLGIQTHPSQIVIACLSLVSVQCLALAKTSKTMLTKNIFLFLSDFKGTLSTV